jgi:hypothetical protein
MTMEFYMVFAGIDFYPHAGMTDFQNGYASLESAEQAFSEIKIGEKWPDPDWKILYKFYLDSLTYELIKSEGEPYGGIY